MPGPTTLLTTIVTFDRSRMYLSLTNPSMLFATLVFQNAHSHVVAVG
jgi:hypothetical protein